MGSENAVQNMEIITWHGVQRNLPEELTMHPMAE